MQKISFFCRDFYLWQGHDLLVVILNAWCLIFTMFKENNWNILKYLQNLSCIKENIFTYWDKNLDFFCLQCMIFKFSMYFLKSVNIKKLKVMMCMSSANTQNRLKKYYEQKSSFSFLLFLINVLLKLTELLQHCFPIQSGS